MWKPTRKMWQKEIAIPKKGWGKEVLLRNFKDILAENRNFLEQGNSKNYLKETDNFLESCCWLEGEKGSEKCGNSCCWSVTLKKRKKAHDAVGGTFTL